MKNENTENEIHIPDINAILSRAISPTIYQIEKEEAQKREEKRRHRVSVIVAVLFGVVSVVLALLAWLCPR